MISGISDLVHVSVCQRCKRKMASAIHTSLGTHKAVTRRALTRGQMVIVHTVTKTQWSHGC